MLNDLQKRTAQAIVNIFETGRALGDYTKVTLLPGDPGHLTYGRSQTTLASGNLHLLIKSYCEAPGGAYGSRLKRYLSKLAACDVSLDTDQTLCSLLKDAGLDPVMRDVQDRFFDRVYWTPSVTDCSTLGVDTALGTTVVYDSRIHGSWALLRKRTERRHGKTTAIGERRWIERYVMERRNWLANHSKTILHATVYRMDAFRTLIEDGSWDLPLPLRVRGVRIDADVLLSSTPVLASAAGESERVLRHTRPLMKGSDVRAVQRALRAAGLSVKVDGVFGAKTEKTVRIFQESRGLTVDGIVGPATRAALGS